MDGILYVRVHAAIGPSRSTQHMACRLLAYLPTNSSGSGSGRDVSKSTETENEGRVR